MTGIMRTESRDLHVIMQQVRPDRNFVVFAGKKLFLIIEARSPGQIAAHLQVFAAAMPEHVRRVDALDRKSTRLNSSHDQISYAVFCLKKKTTTTTHTTSSFLHTG